jgi:hypothetical protein
MRTVFCSLLSASLLIHALLGCCWHDVHEAVACDGPHSVADADDDCDCDHDHDAAQGGHNSHAPCKGHPNCHGLCTYLPVQKSQLSQCLDYVLIDFAVDVKAAGGSQLTAQSFALCESATCASPPVRLHLYHQILLI